MRAEDIGDHATAGRDKKKKPVMISNPVNDGKE